MAFDFCLIGFRVIIGFPQWTGKTLFLLTISPIDLMLFLNICLMHEGVLSAGHCFGQRHNGDCESFNQSQFTRFFTTNCYLFDEKQPQFIGWKSLELTVVSFDWIK